MGAASRVGVSGGATTGKKMAAVVVVTLISLTCAVLGEYPAEAERGYGCERGIAALAYNTGTNCSSFGIENKVNLMQLISFKKILFFPPLWCNFVRGGSHCAADHSFCSRTPFWFFRKLHRYCAYSSRASTSTQSNSRQHPLPELLFSLITIMSGGMGKAGGALSTHTQPKHRNGKINFTLYSSLYPAFVIMYFFTLSCQVVFSEHTPFNHSKHIVMK